MHVRAVNGGTWQEHTVNNNPAALSWVVLCNLFPVNRHVGTDRVASSSRLNFGREECGARGNRVIRSHDRWLMIVGPSIRPPSAAVTNLIRSGFTIRLFIIRSLLQFELRFSNLLLVTTSNVVQSNLATYLLPLIEDRHPRRVQLSVHSPKAFIFEIRGTRTPLLIVPHIWIESCVCSLSITNNKSSPSPTHHQYVHLRIASLAKTYRSRSQSTRFLATP